MKTLKNRNDFEKVYKKGRKVSGKYLRFFFLKNDLARSITRIGVSTNKKIGPAVLRNKIRRIFKEYTREKIKGNKVSFDILFIANTNINKETLERFKEELCFLINKFLVVKD